MAARVNTASVKTIGVSTGSAVLTEEDSQLFSDRLCRWSTVNQQTPAAIVVPKTEDDVARTVQWALANSAPFISKSGGMSLYSTIGENGIIIDLSEFAGLEVDQDRGEATLIGGVLTKTVSTELAKHGCCTTLPSANTVGAIPFFVNGGNSPLLKDLGYASDLITGARMVTADGKLVEVSETQNAELLYALRGAGQYFGIVTRLTVRTYPVQKVFDNHQGMFWSGRFVFPVERTKEVCEVMKQLVN